MHMDLRQAEDLACELIEQHLTPWYPYWKFQWDRSVRRHGYCSYSRKIISLSKPLTEVNTVEHVRHTILHEIAHGLAYHKYGTTGHGWQWKRECVGLGIPPTRTHPGILATLDADTGVRSQVGVTRVAAPLRGLCPTCGASFGRHRMPSSFRYCSKCWKRNGNRPDSSYVLTWYKVDVNGTVLKRMGLSS